MRRALVVGVVAGVVAVAAAGATATAVALRTPAAARSAPAVQTSGTTVATPGPGWNYSAGGSFAAQPVVPPSAVPDGSGTSGTSSSGTSSTGSPAGGLAARDAGPADYVGFRPTRLTLPSGTRAPIQAAGVHADGSLAVPDDPMRVGLWTGGALPGERYGSVVVAGHVDSARYGLGVLAEMLHVKVGQVLTVSGAGRSQAYKVSTVRTIDKARLTADTDVFGQDAAQRLVLITCGGPFDRATHRYRDNIVVVAQPI